MRLPPLCLLLLAAIGCVTGLPEVGDPCAQWQDPGLYTHKTEVDGKKRKAYVWVPATEGPRDVVVALHGAGQTARQFSEVSQFIKRAEAQNFVAVYPQGLAFLWLHGWNAGECCGNVDEPQRDAADVAFLEQLTREVSDLTCGDRVLATGFSNGGMMAHRWGCEGTEVDAVVAASGQLAWKGDCTGDPLPVRHYHGTADPKVSLESEDGKLSVDETMAIWRERNACLDQPPEVTVDGPMTCSVWSCDAPTEQCLIEGWDHRWPGGGNAGALGNGIDVTQEAIDFLWDSQPVQ